MVTKCIKSIIIFSMPIFVHPLLLYVPTISSFNLYFFKHFDVLPFAVNTDLNTVPFALIINVNVKPSLSFPLILIFALSVPLI